MDAESDLNEDILLEFVKEKSKDTKGIYLDQAIYGVIDFSILKKKGYKVIEKVHLGNGKITQILNLPETLKKLVCGNNLLSSLPPLPDTLEELDVSFNMISSLDLSKVKKLKFLNASNNELYEVVGIPESIETINLNENKIREIDFEGLINLKKFESKNNLGIILRNVPENLDLDIEYKLPQNIVGEKVDSVEYIDALNEYFSLKSQYEGKLLQAKRNFKEAKNIYQQNDRVGKKPKMKVIDCIRCKKLGGNFFSKIKNVYIGTCGNEKKKCFEIKIDTKSDNQYDINTKLTNSHIVLERTKELIMMHKMDVFFNHIKIVDSQKTLDLQVTKYMNDNQLFEDILKKFNEIYNNEGRKESVIAEIMKIDEYNDKMDGLNIDDLSERMLMQIELVKEHEKLRKLKYDITEMEMIIRPKDGDIIGSRLVQKEIDIRTTFIVDIEPKVLIYEFHDI